MNRCEFLVLGPFTVQVDGRPVFIGSAQQRAALTALLLSPGRTVPTGRIIEAVWDGSPPASARISLQGIMSRIRSTLSTKDIFFQSHGYVLHVEADKVDSARFESEVERGCQLSAEGATAAAAETLGRALELWRGTPFEGVPGSPLFDGELWRLRRLRLRALEVWAGAELMCGEQERVAAALEPEVVENPLREGLVTHLMTAWHHTGRRAEALRLYEHTRTLLATELGTDPSAPLALAFERLLRAGPGDAARTTKAATGPPGRELETALIARAADTVAAGTGQVIFIHGEAGIGKSCLLEDQAARLELDTLVVRCPEPGIGPPLRWPWTHLLRRLAALRPEAASPALALRRRLLEQPTGGRGAFENHDAVCELLAWAAGRRPFALFLDDLHRADAESLELLEMLLSRLGQTPILLVAAARAPNRYNYTDWCLRLGESRILVLRLGGLSAAGVAELAATRFGRPCDEATAAALVAYTGGNPYLVTAVLAERRDSSYGLRPGLVPRGTLEFLARELDPLPEEVRRVLHTAALLGTHCDVTLLEDVLGRAETGWLPDLDAAVRAGVLRAGPGDPERIRFVREMDRDYLIERLGVGQRRDLCGRIAAAGVERSAPARA